MSRHALFTGASLGLTVGIGFAISLITARVLGPDGQGLLSALRTNATLVAAVLGLGTPASAMYFASRSPNERPALMGASLLHAAVVAAVSLGLAVLFGPELARRQGAVGEGDLYLLAATLAPASYLEYVAVNSLRGQQQFQLANAVTIAGRVVGLALTGLLVVALDLGVAGAVVAVVAIELTQVIGGLPALLRRGVRLSRDVARRFYGYGLRSQVGLLFRVTALRFDVLLLTFFAPLRVVGYYTVALVVAETVQMVPRAFGNIIGPVLAEGKERRQLAGRIVRLNGTISLLYVLALVAVGPLLIDIAYGDAYRPAILPFLILLPGAWLFACGELVSWVLSGQGRPGRASWLATYQGVATLVLDLLLIPPFGAVGAALASAGAYATFGALSLVVLARHDRVPARTLVFVSPRELRSYLQAIRARVSARRSG